MYRNRDSNSCTYQSFSSKHSITQRAETNSVNYSKNTNKGQLIPSTKRYSRYSLLQFNQVLSCNHLYRRHQILSTDDTANSANSADMSLSLNVSREPSSLTKMATEEDEGNQQVSNSDKDSPSQPSWLSTYASAQLKEAPKLSFPDIYEGPASFGKLLEIRWFHSSTLRRSVSSNQGKSTGEVLNTSSDRTGDRNSAMIKHTMPFLRRSLSYIQIAQLNNILHEKINSNSGQKRKQQNISWKQKNVSIAETSPSTTTTNNTNKNTKKRAFISPLHQDDTVQKKKLKVTSSNNIIPLTSSLPPSSTRANGSSSSTTTTLSSSIAKTTKSKTTTKITTSNSTFTNHYDLLQSIFQHRVQQFNPKLSSFYDAESLTLIRSPTTTAATTITATTTELSPKQDQHSPRKKFQQVKQYFSSLLFSKTNKKKKTFNGKMRKVSHGKHYHGKQYSYKQAKNRGGGIESSFGKSFPPYRPFENGKWNEPIMNKKSFELYAEKRLGIQMTKNFLQNFSSSEQNDNDKQNVCKNDNNDDDDDTDIDDNAKRKNDRHERTMLKQIQLSWNELSSSEELYWTQEEAWDLERYIHEKDIFETTKKQGKGGGGGSSGVPFSLGSKWNSNQHNNIFHDDTELCKGGIINNQSTVGNVLYYFVYYKNDTMQIQQEHRFDRRCPFCHFHAGSNRGVLVHCHTTHGDDLSFDGGIDENNNFHVIIRSNKWKEMQNHSKRDKSFICLSSKIKNHIHLSTIEHKEFKIPFIPKPKEITLHLEPALRKRKIRSIEQQNGSIHPDAKSQYIISDNQGPIRQYYHSKTNLPINLKEWYQNNDSDDEDDDSWIRQMGERLMDELDDVSPKEKLFMNTWNQYIKSNVVVADSAIPRKCHGFIVHNHDRIDQGGLRDHLLLHMFNLWDHGLMFSYQIVKLMSLFDALTIQSRNQGAIDDTERAIQNGNVDDIVEEKKITE